MIQSIKGYLERRRIRKAFGKMASPSAVKSVLRDDVLTGSKQLEERILDIVLILVSGSEHVDLIGKIAVVADLAEQHETGSFGSIAGFLVFCYGIHRTGQTDNERRRVEFVGAVQQKLGKSVRVVHGRGFGHVGLVGSHASFTYSFVVRNFSESLRLLSNLQDGRSKGSRV